MAITLKHKLVFSSLCVLLLMGATGIFGYNMTDNLAKKQDEGVTAYTVAADAISASGVGASLYQIVADAIINRDLATTEKEWEEEKTASLKKLTNLEAELDAPEDKKLIKDALASLNAFINLFEHESLPELRKISSLEINPTIREIDEKMDKVIAASQKALKELAEKHLAEAKQGDVDFDVISQSGKKDMLICLVGGFIFSLLNTLYLIYQISLPIRGMTDAMKQLAAGNKDQDIPSINRLDEIGSMANAVVIFKENMIEADRLAAEQETLKKRTEEEKRAMMFKLADDFEAGVQGIINTVASASTELYHTAESMQKTVATVSVESGDAATASQQTSGNVQSIASAVEELSSSIKEISSQVAKSSGVVNEAAAKTAYADTTVLALTEAVAQIGSISELIQNIAGQINLLALNATIESARAGDAGKGFAVVASEVKNLATQTTKATEEIAKQIENVQSVSVEVAASLKDIQSAVSNATQYSTSIASAVEEQSAVTREISSNMQQAASGVGSINASISSITKGASDADLGAKEVLSAAKMLSEQSEKLNGEVKGFLAGVRG